MGIYAKITENMYKSFNLKYVADTNFVIYVLKNYYLPKIYFLENLDVELKYIEPSKLKSLIKVQHKTAYAKSNDEILLDFAKKFQYTILTYDKLLVAKAKKERVFCISPSKKLFYNLFKV